MKRLSEVLICLFVFGICAFAAYPVTTIRDTNNNALAVNADGSINISIAGTTTFNSTITVNGSIITTGTVTAYGGYVGTTVTLTTPGLIGETTMQFVTSPIPAAASTAWVTVSTLTVTAGSWELFGVCISSGNGATFIANNDMITRISTTAATVSQLTNNNLVGYDMMPESPNITGSATLIESSTFPLNIFVNPTVTTTYYLSAECVYSSGTPKWFGSFLATRIR